MARISDDVATLKMKTFAFGVVAGLIGGAIPLVLTIVLWSWK